MAKFRSQVYTTIRGSVGGVTYTANQHQPLIAKARVSPVNPITEFQSIMRGAFSAASSFWRQITDAERLGWETYADTVNLPGPLGVHTVDGRTMFIRNVATAQYFQGRFPAISGGVAFTPPTILGPMDLFLVGTILPPLGNTGFGVSANSSEAEDWILYAEISRSFNADRRRFKGPFKGSTLSGVAQAGAGQAAIQFDGLEAGKVYFVKIRAFIDVDQHRLSTDHILRVVATVGIP